MVGVMARSIFMLRHKASSPYDFNIQFPMYTKFITHVYDVTLNTPMRQYCVTSMAPSTGHRNSVKHPIYMTFMFFPPYHTLQDDMQLKGEHTLWQRHRRSIMKTKLTTNLFEGLFTCSPFCFYFSVHYLIPAGAGHQMIKDQLPHSSPEHIGQYAVIVTVPHVGHRKWLLTPSCTVPNMEDVYTIHTTTMVVIPVL